MSEVEAQARVRVGAGQRPRQRVSEVPAPPDAVGAEDVDAQDPTVAGAPGDAGEGLGGEEAGRLVGAELVGLRECVACCDDLVPDGADAPDVL